MKIDCNMFSKTIEGCFYLFLKLVACHLLVIKLRTFMQIHILMDAIKVAQFK